eukprot:CAMPEP_0175139440 /NCGR_PEP_ID=MMETSP0087-20121206/10903_1 /TAXON_ID=136419 /ORGANISM="Unknown Unknown, Strain D1" /LENGTH=82 /DNA_ID=CAMNT_0016422449 /DNA_START=227 /DNA_END=475 /DNA_ORIENTATION=+
MNFSMLLYDGQARAQACLARVHRPAARHSEHAANPPSPPTGSDTEATAVPAAVLQFRVVCAELGLCLCGEEARAQATHSAFV